MCMPHAGEISIQQQSNSNVGYKHSSSNAENNPV